MRACNYSLRSMLRRMRRFWAGGRQPFPYRTTEGLPVTHQEKSRSSPERFSNLAWTVSSCRLPQFNRISFRVVQAGEAAVAIRLRVKLDLDSCGS